MTQRHLFRSLRSINFSAVKPATTIAALLLSGALAAPSQAMTTVDDTLVSGGFTRDFAYHKPVGFTGDTAIISFHGKGNNGRKWLKNKWVGQDEKDFMIVCPSALKWDDNVRRWIAPDQDGESLLPTGAGGYTDVDFIRDLADELYVDHGVTKVYLAGFSSGAKMTMVMYFEGLSEAEGFAAVGRGLRTIYEFSTPSTVKPFYYQVGTDDPNWPGDTDDLSFPDTKAKIEAVNGCTGQTVDSSGSACGHTVNDVTYSSCTGATLNMRSLVGEGHVWTQCAGYKTQAEIVAIFGL